MCLFAPCRASCERHRPIRHHRTLLYHHVPEQNSQKTHCKKEEEMLHLLTKVLEPRELLMILSAFSLSIIDLANRL